MLWLALLLLLVLALDRPLRRESTTESRDLMVTGMVAEVGMMVEEEGMITAGAMIVVDTVETAALTDMKIVKLARPWTAFWSLLRVSTLGIFSSMLQQVILRRSLSRSVPLSQQSLPAMPED